MIRDGSRPSPALPARDRQRGRDCHIARSRTRACWVSPPRDHHVAACPGLGLSSLTALLAGRRLVGLRLSRLLFLLVLQLLDELSDGVWNGSIEELAVGGFQLLAENS